MKWRLSASRCKGSHGVDQLSTRANPPTHAPCRMHTGLMIALIGQRPYLLTLQRLSALVRVSHRYFATLRLIGIVRADRMAAVSSRAARHTSHLLSGLSRGLVRVPISEVPVAALSYVTLQQIPWTTKPLSSWGNPDVGTNSRRGCSLRDLSPQP